MLGLTTSFRPRPIDVNQKLGVVFSEEDECSPEDGTLSSPESDRRGSSFRGLASGRRSSARDLFHQQTVHPAKVLHLLLLKIINLIVLFHLKKGVLLSSAHSSPPPPFPSISAHVLLNIQEVITPTFREVNDSETVTTTSTWKRPHKYIQSTGCALVHFVHPEITITIIIISCNSLIKVVAILPVKTQVMLDKAIEYDLDSEDEAFREKFNETNHNKQCLTENLMEKLIDLFEKEFFKKVSLTQQQVRPSE